MSKHVYKDYNKDDLKLDDEVVFVDRVSGGFRLGKIAEFRKYAVGILANSERKGIVTYWRSGKEVMKTCSVCG